MKKCTICGEEYSAGTLKCKCDWDYTQDILNFPSLTKFSTQQLNEELQKIETAKQLYEEKTRPKTPFEQDLKGAQAGDPARQAFYWYSQIADLGFADSQYELGQCYENGIGTDIDYQKALEWYDKAAKQGNNQAEKAAFKLREKIATQCNDLIREIDRLPSSITFRNINNVRALKDKFDELQEPYKRMIKNKNKLDDALEQVAAIEKNISRLKPDEDKKTGRIIWFYLLFTALIIFAYSFFYSQDYFNWCVNLAGGNPHMLTFVISLPATIGAVAGLLISYDFEKIINFSILASAGVILLFGLVPNPVLFSGIEYPAIIAQANTAINCICFGLIVVSSIAYSSSPRIAIFGIYLPILFLFINNLLISNYLLLEGVTLRSLIILSLFVITALLCFFGPLVPLIPALGCVSLTFIEHISLNLTSGAMKIPFWLVVGTIKWGPAILVASLFYSLLAKIYDNKDTYFDDYRATILAIIHMTLFMIFVLLHALPLIIMIVLTLINFVKAIFV